MASYFPPLREGLREGVFQRYINKYKYSHKKHPLLNPLPQGRGNKKQILYTGIE